MLYIKSETNRTYTAVNSKNVNIFAGKRFVDMETDTMFESLNITTELGTTEIVGYHESLIGKAVDALFEYIINFDFTENKNTIIEINDICKC